MDKETIIEGLARLHIGEWRKEYNTARFGYVVMDGNSWHLKIHFSNGYKAVEIGGWNSYPYNFDRFFELFNIRYFTRKDIKV